MHPTAEEFDKKVLAEYKKLTDTIYYRVRISHDLDVSKYNYFADLCAEILADADGWRKYGFKFVETDRNHLDEYKPIKVNQRKHPAFYTNIKTPLTIYLTTNLAAASLCSMNGFSCWRYNTNDIIINAHNWEGGSKSQLPLDQYRKYVINHEMGHALGLDHNKCQIKECERRGISPCPASIMQQMTRGPSAIAPCVEAYLPLNPSWNVDNPRIHGDFKNKTVGGSTSHQSSIYLIILIIILIFMYNILASTVSTVSTVNTKTNKKMNSKNNVY